KLKAEHPNPRYELNFENPLQLLVATILAAQCTDERVNQVTPALFAKYPDARSYADADLAELEQTSSRRGSTATRPRRSRTPAAPWSITSAGRCRPRWTRC